MQIQEKSFYYFYKLTFLRKNAKPFVMALIKREILTSCEILYTKSSMCNQILFCKKDAFQNTDFSHLKCQLKWKKYWHRMFIKIFQVSADEGMVK